MTQKALLLLRETYICSRLFESRERQALRKKLESAKHRVFESLPNACIERLSQYTTMSSSYKGGGYKGSGKKGGGYKGKGKGKKGGAIDPRFAHHTASQLLAHILNSTARHGSLDCRSRGLKHVAGSGVTSSITAAVKGARGPACQHYATELTFDLNGKLTKSIGARHKRVRSGHHSVLSSSFQPVPNAPSSAPRPPPFREQSSASWISGCPTLTGCTSAFFRYRVSACAWTCLSVLYLCAPALCALLSASTFEIDFAETQSEQSSSHLSSSPTRLFSHQQRISPLHLRNFSVFDSET